MPGHTLESSYVLERDSVTTIHDEIKAIYVPPKIKAKLELQAEEKAAFDLKERQEFDRQNGEGALREGQDLSDLEYKAAKKDFYIDRLTFGYQQKVFSRNNSNSSGRGL